MNRQIKKIHCPYAYIRNEAKACPHRFDCTSEGKLCEGRKYELQKVRRIDCQACWLAGSCNQRAQPLTTQEQKRESKQKTELPSEYKMQGACSAVRNLANKVIRGLNEKEILLDQFNWIDGPLPDNKRDRYEDAFTFVSSDEGRDHTCTYMSMDLYQDKPVKPGTIETIEVRKTRQLFPDADKAVMFVGCGFDYRRIHDKWTLIQYGGRQGRMYCSYKDSFYEVILHSSPLVFERDDIKEIFLEHVRQYRPLKTHKGKYIEPLYNPMRMRFDTKADIQDLLVRPYQGQRYLTQAEISVILGIESPQRVSKAKREIEREVEADYKSSRPGKVTDKQKLYFFERLNGRKSRRQVAEKYGISGQAVSKLIKKAIKKWQEYRLYTKKVVATPLYIERGKAPRTLARRPTEMKSKVISFRVPGEIASHLKGEARARGMSVNDLVKSKLLLSAPSDVGVLAFVTDMATQVGVEAGIIVENIIVTFMAQLSARMQCDRAPIDLPMFMFTDEGVVRGLPLFDTLTQKYVRELEDERERILLENERWGHPLNEDDKAFLMKRKAGSTYWRSPEGQEEKKRLEEQQKKRDAELTLVDEYKRTRPDLIKQNVPATPSIVQLIRFHQRGELTDEQLRALVLSTLKEYGYIPSGDTTSE